MLERGIDGPRIDAPAKINLALHVVGRRTDGYHLLESLAVFTGLGDRIAVEPATLDCLAVTGPFAAAVPLDDGNLVLAARDRLRARFPDQPRGPVSIQLEKNLPVASGIGGGSSDAAATLRALNALWNLAVSPGDLARISLGLGADLPMCLAGRPLIARGIGDRIDVLADFPSLHLVLVNPGVPVATPDVFKSLASRDNPGLPPLPARASAAAVIEWLNETRNDLEAPARKLAPEIGDALSVLGQAGSRFARMSGSGATCFGLFEDAARAVEAADQIHRRHPNWFVAATRSGGAQTDAAS